MTTLHQLACATSFLPLGITHLIVLTVACTWQKSMQVYCTHPSLVAIKCSLCSKLYLLKYLIYRLAYCHATGCDGLSLARSQVPTKSSLSFPFSAVQERENTMEGSWVELRTGRNHSPATSWLTQACLGEISSINYQSNKSRVTRK